MIASEAAIAHGAEKTVHARIAIDAYLFIGLVATIPAFYLHLAPAIAAWRWVGTALYAVAAVLLASAVYMRRTRKAGIAHSGVRIGSFALNSIDSAIVLGIALSIASGPAPWGVVQWVWRLASVALIALRLVLCLLPLVTRRKTVFVLLLGVVTVLLSGAGFYWLEPTVQSYADGLWLAFVTGATVGYGDLVPTSPAARVLAVFMVLIGFALLSLLTASIAALLIGRDEERLRREMHHDMKALHAEVRELRRELQQRQ